jgi:hypothetical protein
MITTGDLAVVDPTSLSLTMAGSNLSSNVVVGVGVSVLVTNSTPTERSCF